jgi:hypothetical protein
LAFFFACAGAAIIATLKTAARIGKSFFIYASSLARPAVVFRPSRALRIRQRRRASNARRFVRPPRGRR